MRTSISPLQRVRSLLAGFGAALLALLVLASPSHAHSVLLGTDPEDKAQLAAAPDAVSLTFNEDITSLGTEVVITTDDGEDITQGETQIDGPVVTQALAGARPAGTYTVTWRAVSADGHPISGEFTFTAAEAVGGEGTAPEEEAPDAPADSEGPAEPAETPAAADDAASDDTATDDAATDDPAADDAEEDGGLSASTWVVIGIIIVAAIVLVTVLARSMGANREE